MASNHYLNWDTKKIDVPPGLPPETPLPASTIERLYDEGYVATRVGKGIFNKTRSLRIRLSEYAPSSENRRIMRKATERGVAFETTGLPYERYHWTIHKMAKEFYTEKFGADTFSANKVREIMSVLGSTDFNTLLIYRSVIESNQQAIGYCIGLRTQRIFHYSYPFYNRRFAERELPSLGLSMMTQAVEWAKGSGHEFIYLGSLQRPSDTYKLQFAGAEWFDGERWQTDMAALKKILAELPQVPGQEKEDDMGIDAHDQQTAAISTSSPDA